MFWFSFCLELSLHDISVAVISGDNVLVKRVTPILRTWGRTIPQLVVYTNNCTQDEKNQLLSMPHLGNVSIVVIPEVTEYLIGSTKNTNWKRAQKRFLLNVEHLIRTYPNSVWYGITDDDTYLFTENVKNFLQTLDSNRSIITGRTWVFYLQKEAVRYTSLFSQFGAGTFFTRSFALNIVENLSTCNEIFNEQSPADLRFSLCYQRVHGKMKFQNSVVRWFEGFFPLSPLNEMNNSFVWNGPGTFHKLINDDVFKVANAHLSFVSDGYFDFQTTHAFKSVIVELTPSTNWQYVFGYAFLLVRHSAEQILSIGLLETFDNGQSFQQKYERNVTVKIHCKADAKGIQVVRVIRGLNTIVQLQVSCPAKTPYYS